MLDGDPLTGRISRSVSFAIEKVLLGGGPRPPAPGDLSPAPAAGCGSLSRGLVPPEAAGQLHGFQLLHLLTQL